MTTSLLAKIPLFSNLPYEELERVEKALDVTKLSEGTILFREGDTGEHFYVIVDGELEILMGAETEEELVLNYIGPGEYIGEMSLIIPGGQRSATVRAKRDSILLGMSRTDFTSLLQRQPKLAHGMVRVLSERLDATNDATFRDLTEKNRALQKAFDELKAAQEQLIEKERLERELQVAANIQLSILPDVLPAPPRFDFGACIDPARQVGGDFYDFIRKDDDNYAVVIGDVADKGVPSAIFMARAHALIAAEADSIEDPGGVLRRVNAHVTHLEKSVQFVTVLYGILNVRTREFTYARAGHEPPLLLQADGTVDRIPHQPGMAIGLWDSIVLDENRIVLPQGSTLLLYTDGMTDCRDPRGNPFGLDHIKEVMKTMVGLSAQEVCDHMLQTLKEYQRGSKQDDDVTLAAIHAQ